MSASIEHVLILGCGYVGEKFAAACLSQHIRVYATTRCTDRAKVLEQQGIDVFVVASPAELPKQLLQSVHAILDSIPLNRDAAGRNAVERDAAGRNDADRGAGSNTSQLYAPQLAWLPEISAQCAQLKWAAYLSTTGVYGDAAGAWVDESWPCRPSSARGAQRLLAEQAWLASGLPAEVFRLAGIYGAERNIIARIRAGGYQAVAWQPAHYSSRVHVDDIVACLMAAMQRPRAGRLVNVADDLPLPHADYVCEIARMIGIRSCGEGTIGLGSIEVGAIGIEPPKILSPEEGARCLSPSMMAFFQDNKRVSNQRLHDELLTELKYPDFRCGMASILASMGE